MPQYTDWGDLPPRYIEDIAYTRALEIGRTVLGLPKDFPENAVISALLTEVAGAVAQDNTGSNLGAGEGVFAQKVLADLQFKTLVAGAGISLSSDADQITIEAIAGGGTFVEVAGDTMTGALAIGAADDAAYALKLMDAGGAGYLQAFGKQVVQFGKEASALLTSLLDVAYAGTAISIEADRANNGGDDDASIYLTSGDSTLAAMSHQILAGGDQGLRIHYNLIHDAAGFHSSVSSVCGNQLSLEKDGALGLEYTRPADTAAGAYDALAGKAFKLYGAGNPAITDLNDGQKDKYIMLTVGEPGRGMDLGVETAGDGTGYGTRFRIEDGASANPISVYVDSDLQQMTVGVADSGGAGFRLLRVPN